MQKKASYNLFLTWLLEPLDSRLEIRYCPNEVTFKCYLQVLQFFHDKCQQHLTRLHGDLCTEADVIEPLKRKCSSSRKRKRSLEGKPFNDGNCAAKGCHLAKQSFAHISVTIDQLTDRQNSFLKTLGDYESGLQQALRETTGERDSNEYEHGQVTHNSTLLRLKPERKRRFLWTEEYDR